MDFCPCNTNLYFYEAIDLEIDDLIQPIIKKEFTECAVLTITHRLNTILDYEQIRFLTKKKFQACIINLHISMSKCSGTQNQYHLNSKNK